MRRLLPLMLPLMLVAASSPAQPQAETADSTLARARAEAAAASKRLSALEAAAARAQGEAAKLRAEQAAAAAAIEEAEARIGAADAGLRLARASEALAAQRLAAKRAPLSALLAGLATMGRQPPLLALAERGSVDEIVRVKALLDATMPIIERRSAALRAELAGRQALAAAAGQARRALADDRAELQRRRERFAELEFRAAERAQKLAEEAVGAGDRVLAGDEALSLAGNAAVEQRAARINAARIARLGFAPARPFRGDSALPAQDFAYSLPSDAPLIDGLGSISRAGIASRGLRLSTQRGGSVIAPADGKILFAGPFRSQDGIVIIDHGDGWTSLLLGVASELPRGSRVRRGAFLGRSLGPLGVELRRDGVPVSPALIAASSVPLSNSGDNR